MIIKGLDDDADTTVICSVPVIPEPSCADALTVTVPAVVAVSKPVEEIVAVPVPFVTDQVVFLLVAFAGKTAALICKVLLAATVVTEPAPVTVMLVTGIA
jgi:hypothetical protein